MHVAGVSARGEDIASLRDAGLGLLAHDLPSKSLRPPIPDKSKKSLLRGFNHKVLARLLCPITLLPQFDENPEEQD